MLSASVRLCLLICVCKLSVAQRSCWNQQLYRTHDACVLLTRPRDPAKPGRDQRLSVCQQQDGGQRPSWGAGGKFWSVTTASVPAARLPSPALFFNDAVVLVAVASELASNLPLQMLLYFNRFFFPCWWISTVCMLELKVSCRVILLRNTKWVFNVGESAY